MVKTIKHCKVVTRHTSFVIMILVTCNGIPKCTPISAQMSCPLWPCKELRWFTSIIHHAPHTSARGGTARRLVCHSLYQDELYAGYRRAIAIPTVYSFFVIDTWAVQPTNILIVMAIGGPNARADYRINETEVQCLGAQNTRSLRQGQLLVRPRHWQWRRWRQWQTWPTRDRLWMS